MKSNRALLVGITGGIASGKSLIASWLMQQGYTVINFDELGHDVLQDAAIIRRVQLLFGDEILKDGVVSREALGKMVYENADTLSQLNALMHPAIRALAQKRIDAFDGDLLFLEIPLLFESGLERCVDVSVLLVAPLEQRIARLCTRDGIDTAYARKKIASQMDDAEKAPRADILLKNDGTPAELETACHALIAELRQTPRRSVIPFDQFSVAKTGD